MSGRRPRAICHAGIAYTACPYSGPYHSYVQTIRLGHNPASGTSSPLLSSIHLAAASPAASRDTYARSGSDARISSFPGHHLLMRGSTVRPSVVFRYHSILFIFALSSHSCCITRSRYGSGTFIYRCHIHTAKNLCCYSVWPVTPSIQMQLYTSQKHTVKVPSRVMCGH